MLEYPRTHQRDQLAKLREKFKRIVEIVWKDAEEFGETGWNNLEETLKHSKKPCPTMKNVGYVLHEDSDHISIVSSMGADVCGTLEKIPKSFVISIKEISEQIETSTGGNQ